ncbi:hypothetical protein J7I93_04645 [Bacillus sp. ISL-47]|uniref:hypothetical protein n=1 Tax=Bacillus sp. ISL-47 TaxID=2819130 RepID=UPI001BED105C|nr:hypothetical protein [Bacillus sp. ISL-47]MBT2687468.1 hypothetical protein [Bacillus sp. ISL-47]MBT2711009.1 hypothetical protein [Pseudomonas sp. ISL-84]
MFVKLYEYRIRPENEQELLDIQKKAGEIYRKYTEVQTSVLKSKEDQSKWTEISYFKSEEEYHNMLPLINQDDEIQELFKKFQSLLISSIKEEDYEQKNLNQAGQ